MLHHQPNAFGIDEGAVLDRPHPGFDRLLDALGRVGVGHHRHAEAGRLRHRNLELLGAEVDILGVVAGRHEGTGHQQLDPVAAVLDLLADGPADLVNAIDDQAVGDQMLFGRKEVDVAAAAGDRQIVGCDRQPRPLEETPVDGPSNLDRRIEDVRRRRRCEGRSNPRRGCPAPPSDLAAPWRRMTL